MHVLVAQNKNKKKRKITVTRHANCLLQKRTKGEEEKIADAPRENATHLIPTTLPSGFFLEYKILIGILQEWYCFLRNTCEIPAFKEAMIASLTT